MSCSLADPVIDRTTSTAVDNPNDTTSDATSNTDNTTSDIVTSTKQTVDNNAKQQQQTEVWFCCCLCFVFTANCCFRNKSKQILDVDVCSRYK